MIPRTHREVRLAARPVGVPEMLVRVGPDPAPAHAPEPGPHGDAGERR